MAVRGFDGFLYAEANIRRPAEEPDSHQTEEPYRSPFRKDYARLIHSPAFRRLQGKTQLFPGSESDFFRNRLTHSLEVAQVAKSIATRINSNFEPFNSKISKTNNWRIDLDLVEFSGLAHDLGHPPFGHNGEEALDERMRDQGGFEGNAQTLRILVRLEKKRLYDSSLAAMADNGRDNRAGLNLTYRSLASILKYDKEITKRGKGADLIKGYYSTERDIVREIKLAVTGKKNYSGPFKTIECSIMDLADDIAYSTYDLEDALKAGFLSLLDFLTLEQDSDLFFRVTKKVWNRTKTDSVRIEGDKISSALKDDFVALQKEIIRILIETISSIFVASRDQMAEKEANDIKAHILESGIENPETEALLISWVYRSAEQIQKNGYLRTDFTSNLVGEFIRGTTVELNSEFPALSEVKLEPAKLTKIEAIKNYTYEAHIMSPRLKVAEYRGKDFVKAIFDALTSDSGYLLMPGDWQSLYNSKSDLDWQRRVVCDYIGGMTDRYALEFYGRLNSENPQTIFKDH